MTDRRRAAALYLLAAFALGACGGTPQTPPPGLASAPEVSALPGGGCYDRPLVMRVNGAPHAMSRTGPESFVVSGPVFSALRVRLATDGERAFIGTAQGLRPLEGDVASCMLSGEGRLVSRSRQLPVEIAIAPAA